MLSDGFQMKMPIMPSLQKYLFILRCINLILVEQMVNREIKRRNWVRGQKVRCRIPWKLPKSTNSYQNFNKIRLLYRNLYVKNCKIKASNMIFLANNYVQICTKNKCLLTKYTQMKIRYLNKVKKTSILILMVQELTCNLKISKMWRLM